MWDERIKIATQGGTLGSAGWSVGWFPANMWRWGDAPCCATDGAGRKPQGAQTNACHRICSTMRSRDCWNGAPACFHTLSAERRWSPNWLGSRGEDYRSVPRPLSSPCLWGAFQLGLLRWGDWCQLWARLADFEAAMWGEHEPSCWTNWRDWALQE